ncbi:MAG: ATP-binding protein [Actinomycetota bacterium]
MTDLHEPGERVELRLTHADVAAAPARRLIEERLHGVLPRDRLEDVRLLTDELVSNAVRHARPERDGAVGVRLEVLPDRVRVFVTDGSPLFEWATRASVELAGRFGLVLIDHLADRWGLSLDGQKAVWFEVDRVTGSGGSAPARTG